MPLVVVHAAEEQHLLTSCAEGSARRGAAVTAG